MVSRLLLFTITVTAVWFAGCSSKQNPNILGTMDEKTGRKYTSEGGGFNPTRYDQQMTAPGLAFIEGGTFHMGGGEKDIGYEMNNRERQVTVHSFYMDITEVSNVEWKGFLFANSDQSQDSVKKLLPDTTVWYRELAYNEPMVEFYFQHPAFNNYPVVGVNWYQANAYCKWRTKIVNDDLVAKGAKSKGGPPVLYPEYRLPTEAEWEYAARGLLEQELYPWEGKSLRNADGKFMANFKRGRGDYAGRSKEGGSRLVEGLNDRYMIPAPVKEYWPNDFGLYCMAGNVAEWTADAYRVLAYDDVEDFNSFRRRGAYSKGVSGLRPGLNSQLAVLEVGQDRSDVLEDDTQYAVADKSDSRLQPTPFPSLLFNPNLTATDPTRSQHDRVKVYRGGSWNDLAYYLTCGARRFYEADSSASFIGFRCCMTRVGSPSLY